MASQKPKQPEQPCDCYWGTKYGPLKCECNLVVKEQQKVPAKAAIPKEGLCSKEEKGFRCENPDCRFEHRLARERGRDNGLCKEFLTNGFCVMGNECPCGHLKICRDNAQGFCPRSDFFCHFAHPSKEQCKFFYSPKGCKNGQACTFKH